MKQHFLVLLFLVLSSCIHPTQSEVMPSTSAARHFLEVYSSTQESSISAVGIYDIQLTPEGGSVKWARLANTYGAVIQYGYNCKFNISRKSYAVQCEPELSLINRRLSFYLDQSRTIRYSMKSKAGPTSPVFVLE